MPPRPAPATAAAHPAQRITAIITTSPRAPGAAANSRQQLHLKPRNMLTQLGEWARLGFLTRTGPGTYAAQHAASHGILDNRTDP